MAALEALEAEIEALFEEARRHARRRRQRNGATALLAAGIGAGLFFGFGAASGGGSSTHNGQPASNAAVPPQAVSVRPVAAVFRNGALTAVVSDTYRGGVYSIGRGGLGRLLLPCSAAEGCTDLQSAAWSPDGKRLAFNVTSYKEISAYNGLHVVDFATGQQWRLPDLGDVRDISWSRDGTRLAFVNEPWRIMLMNADGSGVRRLDIGTTARASSPSWSPSGTQIAFASKDDGYWSIYVVGVDGSHRRLLARHASAPAWSPDGREIAYRALDGIRLMSPDGRPRPSYLLTGAIGLPGPPVWSPDGRKIAVARPFRGTYVMNRDGSGLTRLTRSTGLLNGPRLSQQALAWRPLVSVLFTSAPPQLTASRR